MLRCGEICTLAQYNSLRHPIGAVLLTGSAFIESFFSRYGPVLFNPVRGRPRAPRAVAALGCCQ